MSRCFLVLIALCGFAHSADGGPVTTLPSTIASTKPFLQPIELTSAIYLAGTKTSIAVSSDGLLTRVHILDKSYFKQGIEHKIQDIERRRGQLSDEQMADLEGLFVKWNSFLSAPYGGVADSKTVSLRYGDKIVSGGSSIPAQVTEIEKRLMDLSRSMPVVTP